MLTIQHTNNTHTVEQQWEFYSALTLIIDIQGRPTVCSVRKYVAKGKAGIAPEQRGGGKLYPGAVFQAAATQISVSGANGIEMSTKTAVQNIRVAVEGTVFQGKGKGKPSDSSRHMERRLRKE